MTVILAVLVAAARGEQRVHSDHAARPVDLERRPVVAGGSAHDRDQADRDPADRTVEGMHVLVSGEDRRRQCRAHRSFRKSQLTIFMGVTLSQA